MKITEVRPLLLDRFLFVEVTTDSGLKGLGESGAWAYLEASAEAINTFKRYLIGQDPLRIEHHWQYLYRWTHFRGAAIVGALSAIDIALWDIAGKHLGVPSYQLLGGKCRDTARAYFHVFGDTTETLVQACIDAKEKGFTAIGHLSPFLDEPRDKPYYETHVSMIETAVDRVRQYRGAAGPNVDLCLELHRRLTPAQAIALARGVEQYKPFFIEDPTLPDNMDAMAEIASKIHVPIATGERLHTIHEFEMLLARNAVQYVRPDVCLCGGLTHAKKIAALAEARYVGVVPHNPLSPVSTAACVQLAACIPNFALQEYPLMEGAERAAHIPFGGEAVAAGLVKTALTVENGFIVIPDVPGIGVELAEDAETRFPFRPRPVKTRLHRDGSVVDQ
ncbi:MAG: mandelate racemase/muconate lactonizing enzyme family protein [Acidiferrobacterales bacterium]